MGTDEDVTADEDIVKYWNFLGEYTEGPALGYLTELTRDNLIAALSTFCWLVTVQHEHVGSIRDSIETPVHGGFRITPEAVAVDKDSYVGAMILMAMTSLRTPSLKSKFSDYWKTDEEVARWQKFQDGLIALEEKVDERNKTRLFRVETVNPKLL